MKTPIGSFYTGNGRWKCRWVGESVYAKVIHHEEREGRKWFCFNYIYIAMVNKKPNPKNCWINYIEDRKDHGYVWLTDPSILKQHRMWFNREEKLIKIGSF
jgi:hypothetical protein